MIENRPAHPPAARREPKPTTLHGVTLVDDYAWLRQKDSPEVTAYLEAENAWAEAEMAPLDGLREDLYREMLGHIKQTDVSVPYRYGEWWYTTRTEEGLQYAIHCRRRGTAEGPDATAAEEVLLDGNQLAQGHAFFSIGSTDITDDGRWLAYTTDTTGFRQYTLRIKDLETGETLAGTVERVGSVVWAADNRTLFYTVEDEEQKRQYQFWRHTLGRPHAEDALLYQDDDERFNLAAGRTRDGAFVLLDSASHTTSETWWLPADRPEAPLTLIAAREDEHEYAVDHRNGRWFIRTNDQGRNFRLVTAPVATAGREHWT
ncbi:MAG: oligopeptidase B, partial [Terracidiphilus sp.]